MIQYVGIILVKPDGSVLIQHRDNKAETGPNTWATVGGKREIDDPDLKRAAARELKDETEYIIDPDILRFLDYTEYPNDRGKSVKWSIFWAPYDGKQEIHCFEGEKIKFIQPREFKNLNFYLGFERIFRKASEKAFYSFMERGI